MTGASGAALSGRARRLAGMLASWPRQRVQLEELWRILDQADPTTRTDIRRRRTLAELIAELVAAELVSLPSSRSYDHSELPGLPKFLTVVRAGRVSEAERSIVWHPSLAWVPQASLTRPQLGIMQRVNDWLHDSRDHLVVPARERSVEVFGDEKMLDRLVGSALFGPGRLTLELLRCRTVAPRLHCESAGDGDLLLVVENSDTFDSLLRVLRSRDDHRVGMVGWGAGTGFEASVLSIARLEHPTTEVRYFGDLDENGLRIPANASALAESVGLPTVRPATGLYGAMFRRARGQAGQRKVTAEAAATLSVWLDPEQHDAAAKLLTTGERLAQEAVGLSYLSRHEDWLDSLL
jgi:Protein of unknown function C-terminus (DUF2399)